jgi:hypothetical protein
MIIHAKVNQNGELTTKIPKSLWGKSVVISECSVSVETDWEMIETILKEADKLDFHRKTHEEILRDIGIFREIG